MVELPGSATKNNIQARVINDGQQLSIELGLDGVVGKPSSFFSEIARRFGSDPVSGNKTSQVSKMAALHPRRQNLEIAAKRNKGKKLKMVLDLPEPVSSQFVTYKLRTPSDVLKMTGRDLVKMKSTGSVLYCLELSSRSSFGMMHGTSNEQDAVVVIEHH